MRSGDMDGQSRGDGSLGGSGVGAMDAQSVSALGLYATRIFERNKMHRLSCGMEDELRKCQYQANNSYTPEELQAIRARGAEAVYFGYSSLKIRAAIAWLCEIFLNTTEKVYKLRPTPRPELPQPDIDRLSQAFTEEWLQMLGHTPQTEREWMEFIYYVAERKDQLDNRIDEAARKRADAMEKTIDDQFLEGGWKRAMGDVIADMATYGTGVLRGPTFRRRKRVRYVTQADGTTTCELDWETVPEWSHVDPFDLYPSPGAVDIDDGPLTVKIKLLPRDLSAMIGQPGFDDERIRALIKRWPDGGLILYTHNDTERRDQRNDGGLLNETAFLEGFEFWGEVNGGDLKQWGVTTDLQGEELDDDSYYEANLLVFNGEAVFCTLTDERLGRPFYKGTYHPVAGSWWGNSPSRMMRDIQREMNAAKRNLVLNMAMASGPIKVIDDINAIQNPREAVMTTPWQTIIGKRTAGVNLNRNRPLVEFYTAPSLMTELSNELELCIKHADLLTEIPAYTHGTNVSAGASRTASGLAMLMDAAQRGIKQVIYSLDRDVMRPSIEYIYRLNLLTNPDPTIKGDVNIDAGGILAIISKDKNINFIKEFLVIMQDPQKAAIVGEDGLAALMREYVKMMQYINPDDIVPTKEMLEARRQQQAAMQQQLMMQQMAMGQPQGGASGGPTGVMAPQTTDGIVPVPMQGGMAVNLDPARMGQFQPNGVQAGMIEGGGQ